MYFLKSRFLDNFEKSKCLATCVLQVCLATVGKHGSSGAPLRQGKHVQFATMLAQPASLSYISCPDAICTWCSLWPKSVTRTVQIAWKVGIYPTSEQSDHRHFFWTPRSPPSLPPTPGLREEKGLQLCKAPWDPLASKPHLLWTGQTLFPRGHEPKCSMLLQLPQLSRPTSSLLRKLSSVKSNRTMKLILIFFMESIQRKWGNIHTCMYLRDKVLF